MRRLLIAAGSAVSAYLVVMISYDAVLSGRDGFLYFAFFMAAFMVINAGLQRFLGRRPSGTGQSPGHSHD